MRSTKRASAASAVGLVKVKTYRPFPVQAIVAALAEREGGRRGRPLGVVRLELRTAVPGRRRARCARAGRPIPAMSFIGGLAGADLTPEHFDAVIERTAQLAATAAPGETVWLNEKD